MCIMPYKDKDKRKQYVLEWKRQQRRKRGLMKAGRPPYNEEQKAEAKCKRREYEKEWNKQNRDKSIESYLWYAARRRAKDNQLEFNITKEDIIIPEVCPYLKLPFQLLNRRRGQSRTTWPSIDRIDNTKGYVLGNIEVISHLANTMKGKATFEMLLNFAREIILRYENPDNRL